MCRIRKVRASPCSAVANNDRPAFDKLWQWTDNTLRNKSNGLFYWRYNPVAPDPIADKNNASDGDTLIAGRCCARKSSGRISAMRLPLTPSPPPC